MGSSSSKGASNKIEPVLSKSESWSTLDGFVTTESGINKRETLAVSTTVNDKEIKQVKTWMDFPERKPKSTLNLDVHLSHLQHKKSQANFAGNSTNSEPSRLFHSKEDDLTESLSREKHLMLKHSVSHTNVTGHHPGKPSRVSFKPSGHNSGLDTSAHRIERQATRMIVERQKSKMGHEMLKDTPSTVSNSGQAQQGSFKSKQQSQNLVKSLSPMEDSEERLDIQVDALNNITREPSERQIKRQVQRWKTEYSLGKIEEKSPSPKLNRKALKPKHSKSFYDLRKAMVNRENISLEHSSIVIKPLLREDDHLVSDQSTDTLQEEIPSKPTNTLQEKIPSKPANTLQEKIPSKPTNTLQEKTPSKPTNDGPFEHVIEDIPTTSKPVPQQTERKLITPKEKEIKIYSKDHFEYAISKDSPPGFEIVVDTTESERDCKSLVENINVKADEVSFRNEIDKVIQLWKSNGFLKSIEEYVLSVSPGSNYSVSEVAHSIASSDANYLVALSDNNIHIQVAKAYAIYCWIANNMTCNITSMLVDEEEQYGFSPERNDVESKSASFDHCTLFVKMALHADLEAAIINGQVRTWKKLNDDLNFPSPHSWNVVKIGDIPLLLDCFFGSGCVNDSFLGIAKEYTPDYFGTPPQQIILTHLPHDPSHQFLEPALSLQDLQPIIPVPVTTLREGIFPLTWSENLLLTSESQYPIISVDLKVSNGNTMISANLIPGPEIDMLEESFDQNVQLKRVNNQWNIKVAIPLKGRYCLNIFCKSCDATHDTLCLSYIIHSEADSELKLGYPKLHEAALTTYNLNLIHWNSPQSYMCQNLSGLLNMVFEAKANVIFDHFILPGRVATPCTFTASNAKRYNTMLLSNSGVDTSLHQLQAVFPTNGWWTIEVSGALPSENKLHNWKYTSLLTYYVYVTVGLPRNSYAHILAPYITFNSIRPINATGEELLTIQFASCKLLNFCHYLTFEQVTGDPYEGFTKIEFEGKITHKNCYVYSLKVIFSQAGTWYVHVLGKEKENSQDLPFSNLFKINADVKEAKVNTSFINYNHSVGESFGVHLQDDGLLTFPDDGQPLCYSFEALPHINFFHAIKMNENEMFPHDYCTYLVSEPSVPAAETNAVNTNVTYTIYAVFPDNGKWLVQLYGAKEDCTNYSLVFTLNVNVNCSSPQLCYPKFNQAFHQLKMGIDTEHALIKKTCEDGEFVLPFKAPDNIYFTWSMELISAGNKMNLSAFIHRRRGNSNNRLFQVIFPKPGEWLIRLFAKKISESSNNFHSILELRLNSLSYKSGVSFPQVFEAFYSTFNLSFDIKHLPLISEVKQLPARVFIPLNSQDTNVLFWHDIDVKGRDDDDSDEVFNLDDQCKMISDPSTGQHRLMVEVNAKGKWTVSLYAKKTTAADKSWTAILKFTVIAV